MQRETERGQRCNRRILVLGAANALMFGGLLGRLYKLQVLDAGAYAVLAERNSVDHRLLVPERGRLLDRNGQAVALNRPTYRLSIVREQTGGFEAVLARLEHLIDLTPEEVGRVLAEAERRRAFVPIAVRDDLDWNTVARVAAHAPDLPGVSLDAGRRRAYPFGSAFAHVLGYVGPVPEAELDGDPLLALPELRIGRDGVERVYDVRLRGSAGTARVEVNALGRQIRELAREPGEAGEDLTLSIDAALQVFACDRLAGERAASAVALDIATGGVLALATVPGFEPAAFENGIPRSLWQRLIGDPLAPLVNKAVAGQYPPGSTFKMIVALAALEAGVLTPDSRVPCPGWVQLGSHRFHCWRKEGHGRLRLVDALAQSCDCYFYEAARRAGIDAVADMARRLGLGVRTGIDLPSEPTGLIPTRAWKQARFGDRWHPGETLVAGIGQGYVTATPLQLAVMTARIASGRAVRPHLATGAVADREPLAIDPAALEQARAGMHAVIHGGRGTARAAALPLDGIEMAGKTGTSQVRRITRAERAAGLHKRERPWEERDHALFVCYAPFDRPRVAVSVVVEHGEGGSKAAAPIGRDIMTEALHRLGLAGPVAVSTVDPGTRG